MEKQAHGSGTASRNDITTTIMIVVALHDQRAA